MSGLRWTSGVACGAMVLGITGFAPPSAGRAPAATDTTSVLSAPSAGDAAPTPSDGLGSKAVRVRNATVNYGALGALCGKEYGRTVTFPLFGDVTVRLREQSRQTAAGRLLWTGGVPGAAGQRAVVTLGGGCDATPGNERLSARFMLGGDAYAVESTGPGTVRISQITPLTDEDETALGTPPTGPPRTVRSAMTPRAATICTGGKGVVLIDLLMGYTPKAVAEAGGESQVKAQITQAVSLANEAFAVSGTKARLRVVRTTPVSVPAATDDVTSTFIKAIADPKDNIADDLHVQRDTYGADLVSVISSGKAAGGLGYSPKDPSASTSNYGFSLVAFSALSHFSLGHEIGHNLGASHDRTTQPVQPPPAGANGYFPQTGNWSSLMAYESGCRKATKGRCDRINHFSNARATYRGEALGVPLGKPGESDTATVFNTTAKAVAAYRPAHSSEQLCGVATSVSPKASGTVSAGATGPYAQGTTATFTAKPASGYVFSHWTLDGKRVTGSSTTTRVAVAFDRKLVANFVKGKTPTPKVTTTASAGGTVAKAPAKKAAAMGAELLYSAVPKPGYHFVGWKVDGAAAGDFSNVAVQTNSKDVTLRAQFAPTRYTLSRHVTGGHGRIELSQPGRFAEGDTVIATAIPAKGFRFVGWLLDGKSYGGKVTPARGETAVTIGAHDRRITARFEPVHPHHSEGHGH